MHTQVFGWGPRLIPEAGTEHLGYLPTEQYTPRETHGSVGEGGREGGAPAAPRKHPQLPGGTGGGGLNPPARPSTRPGLCSEADDRGVDNFSPEAGMRCAPLSNLFFQGDDLRAGRAAQAAASRQRPASGARRRREEGSVLVVFAQEWVLLAALAGGRGRRPKVSRGRSRRGRRPPA